MRQVKAAENGDLPNRNRFTPPRSLKFLISFLYTHTQEDIYGEKLHSARSFQHGLGFLFSLRAFKR
jgi:hypothetical protein